MSPKKMEGCHTLNIPTIFNWTVLRVLYTKLFIIQICQQEMDIKRTPLNIQININYCIPKWFCMLNTPVQRFNMMIPICQKNNT